MEVYEGEVIQILSRSPPPMGGGASDIDPIATGGWGQYFRMTLN